jgi:hypothetical protein
MVFFAFYQVEPHAITGLVICYNEVGKERLQMRCIVDCLPLP